MSHPFGTSFPSSTPQQQPQDPLYGMQAANLTPTGRSLLNNAAGGALDSRLSNSLDSHIADLFSRRSAAMDDLLSARRNNNGAAGLDDTTAVLDACILDLTRRRIGMMGGPGGSAAGGGTGGAANVNQAYDMAPPPQQPMTASNSGLGASGGTAVSVAATSSTLAMRQQQLQEQQFELEQRQKELERQRQQLLAGIQETAMQASGLKASMEQQQQQGGPSRQQWWVCQVCNSKAFASREEAVQHEATCVDGGKAGMNHLSGGTSAPTVGGTGAGMGGGAASVQGGMHTTYGNIPGANAATGAPGLDPASCSGPFTVLPQPMSLAMDSDKDWLTPLHCFVRRHCVQIFCATTQDVTTPAKGKRKPIQVGQVGIRCPHCHTHTGGAKERGSVYYPTTISSIYNATMNLLQRHLHSCSAVPPEIMTRYQTLKADDARSGTSKKYWVESALSLGLVDTPSGIRFSALAPPPLPRLSRQQHSTGVFSANRRNSNDFFSTKSNAEFGKRGMDNNSMEQQVPPSAKELSQSAPLVTDEDKPYATAFSFHLLSQMRSCVFTEADRLGKRKGLPPGFAGLACRHCFGGYGSGRFFPSSIKTLSDTSKTLNVLHNHMMRCRKCPAEVKETLEKLREHHDDERSKMKFGSQKAFFAKIWRRLHENDGTTPNNKRPSSSAFSIQPYSNNKATPQGALDNASWTTTNFSNDPNKRARLGQF